MEAQAERRPQVAAVVEEQQPQQQQQEQEQPGIRAHTTPLQDGLAMVTRATALDKEKRYRDAANAYSLSLMLFDKALEKEDDPAMIALIEGKCTGYKKRLAAIQEHLASIPQPAPAAAAQPRAAAQQHVAAKAASSSRSVDLSELRSALQSHPAAQSQPALSRGHHQQQAAPAYVGYRAFAAAGASPVQGQRSAVLLSQSDSATPQPAHLAFLAELSQTEMDDQEYLIEQKSSVADVAQVYDIVAAAARHMCVGKEEEKRGSYAAAVRNYKAGLSALERAHNLEGNQAIKEVLDVKLQCYQSRVEEIQLIAGKHGTPSVSVAAALKLADAYSKKARDLVDNFQVDEAMEYYNKARAELMSALEREDVIEARKWIAKRILIYERRVLNINKVTRFIRIALPPPWGTLFGVAEGVVRASGVGSFAQKKLDGALEKAATEDDVFKKLDNATKMGSSKSKAKRKAGQKAAENLRPITVDDIFAPLSS
eukprot:CAMPEP_0114624100 /NCGR_PEP_ID=MMETSP0168-20121206/10598_1 /TAXON_ID=95228 ORGANISM="Vannella sp., Strain DIVA3 517/6/12" /NCGR_SAMPLE_ID=MMETSP0168 /ASSEMBLY_ACC=CAM_ASM_000044 /LENGTH=482 /DNA_ID=CAMNT_0001835375 /DNA_START=8 /DNA_END=1453 /DNA_ORIENTATION=-